MLSYSYGILYISAQKNTILNKILMTLGNIFILRGEWGSKSMLKKMFYCEKCNSMWSGNPNTNTKCPDCGNATIPTNISVEEWRSKTPEEKEQIKNDLKGNSEFSGSGITINEDLLAYVRKISEDLNFIRTVLQAFLILFIIGIILMLASSTLL